MSKLTMPMVYKYKGTRNTEVTIMQSNGTIYVLTQYGVCVSECLSGIEVAETLTHLYEGVYA